MKKIIFYTVFLSFSICLSNKAVCQWTQVNNARNNADVSAAKKLDTVNVRTTKIDALKIDTLMFTTATAKEKAFASINTILLNEPNAKIVEKLEKSENEIKNSKNEFSEDERENLLSQITELKRNYKKADKTTKDQDGLIKKLNGDLKKSIEDQSNLNGKLIKAGKETYIVKFQLLQLQFKNLEGIYKKYTADFEKFATIVKTAVVDHRELSDDKSKQFNSNYRGLLEKLGKATVDTSTASALFNEYKVSIDSAAEYNLLLQKIDVSKNENILAQSQPVINKAIRFTEDFEKKLNELSAKLEGNSKEYNEAIKPINEVIGKLTTKEKTANDFEGLVGFNKILDENGSNVPDISILGSYQYGSNDNVGGFAKWHLFTGAAGLKGANTFYNLFVPATSTYGFNALFNLGLSGGAKADNIKKIVGLFAEVNFLGKALKLTDSLTSNAFSLHSKLGAEFIFLKNIFSVRTVVNNLALGNQFKTIEKYKPGAADNIWFVNVGLTALMDLVKDSNFNLRLDLDIIPVKKDIERYIGEDKKLLPLLKVSLIKKINAK